MGKLLAGAVIFAAGLAVGYVMALVDGEVKDE